MPDHPNKTLEDLNREKEQVEIQKLRSEKRKSDIEAGNAIVQGRQLKLQYI